MEKKNFVSIVNACSELYFFADYCTHICEEPENFSEVVRSHAAEGLENLNTYFTKHVDSIVDTENRILTAKEKCFDHDLVSILSRSRRNIIRVAMNGLHYVALTGRRLRCLRRCEMLLITTSICFSEKCRV